jgi:hypothetical protein
MATGGIQVLIVSLRVAGRRTKDFFSGANWKDAVIGALYRYPSNHQNTPPAPSSFTELEAYSYRTVLGHH